MLDAPEFNPAAPNNDELKRQEMALAENNKPSVFKLRAQLLEQGRTDTMLAATDELTLRLKIYASGGENTLHAHTSEDHSFIILQGSARFYGPDDEAIELGRYEGIMLPKGNYYWFHATGDEPLVMIRVGNPNYSKQPKPARIDVHGEEMKGDSKENKKVEVIFRDGEFFG